MDDTRWPFLSIVIPCYNEENRLANLFKELSDFTPKYQGEIEYILVDDGSSDGTKEIIQKHILNSSDSNNYELISYSRNRGKGHALKEGVATAQGEYILTLDADLSAHPETFIRWLNREEFNKHTIYIGSREHSDSNIDALELRRWSGRLFNLWVRIVTGLRIRDTQCGFKCYPSEIGKILFTDLTTIGWAHDVEILYTANKKNIPVKVLPLYWKHVPNSKITLFSDGIQSALEIYSIKKKVDKKLKS